MERRGGSGSLPRFSLERRITVLVLFLSTLVVGFVATRGIPIELIPRGYTEPSLRIVVPWPQAPPEEVMEKIAEPLEEELRTVRGLDRITTVSHSDNCRAFLRFKQGVDMDLAYREVRDRVERARRGFPDDVDQVLIFKDDASGVPVYVIGIAVPPTVLDSYNLIQKQIVLPIERIDGVASVTVQGLEEKEILIEVDRDKTDALGLNIYQLAQELGDDSFSLSSGTVRDGSRKLLLRSIARYATLDELENRPIAPNVRLRDVAQIRYEEPDKDYRVRAMSEPAYALIVFKEGEANAREVSERIDRTLGELQANPRLADVGMITLFATGAVIDEALSKLLGSGLFGGVIAGLVLFAFLRRFRLTMVVNLAVPLSLLMAIVVMYFAGETLNIITLLALMVCVGMLVDNAIVVAENIDRMHAEGRSRKDAAIAGAGEIALAITMSTLTTVIVFLPVSLIEGPGQFFLLRMAIPICVALLASLLVALVFVPLSVYLTLPDHRENRRTHAAARAYGAFRDMVRRGYEATFSRFSAFYVRLLRTFLPRRFDLVFILLVTLVGTIVGARGHLSLVEVQEGEEAGFTLEVRAPEVNTLEETEAWFLRAEAVVESLSTELDLEGWFHWHDRTEGVLQGWFRSPRTNGLDGREVTERVLAALPEAPGFELTTGEEDQTAEGSDETTFMLTVYGEDPVELGRVVNEIEPILTRIPGVLGAKKSLESAPNQLGLVVDRDRAQQLQVDPRVIAGVVGYALRGQSLPKYHDEGREIPVRIRFEEEDRASLTELGSFYVPTGDGGFLPVSALTESDVLSSPEAIVRRDKRVARSITLDLVPGEEKEAKRRLAAVVGNLRLPEGVSFRAEEAGRGFDEDVQSLVFALGLSVVFIYLLMGLLFESFILPLSIIVTIPLASLGVYWIHLATGRDIDFLGVVGCILLVGVVVNNGIVLVDYVNRLRAQGIPRNEALFQAADRRFRPIMMTALTTIGGMIPLALSGRTEIGLSYTSFALTLIGGMTTATLLTLLVIPICYTFFDDLRVLLAAAAGWAGGGPGTWRWTFARGWTFRLGSRSLPRGGSLRAGFRVRREEPRLPTRS